MRSWLGSSRPRSPPRSWTPARRGHERGGGVPGALVGDQSLADQGRVPTEPLPYYDRTTTLREVSPEVVDAFVEFAGPDSGNPLLGIEIRALGGALDREPAIPNAVPMRGIPYVMFGCGVGGPDQADLLRDWLACMEHTFAPWSASDRRMVNLLSKDEATKPSEVRLAYGPDRYDRLARIRRHQHPAAELIRLEFELILVRRMRADKAEGVVDSPHPGIVIGGVGERTIEQRIKLADVADRRRLHPSGQTASAMLAKDSGAILARLSQAITRDGQLRLPR